MDKQKFFNELRKGTLFGKSFSQPQVEGMEALLDEYIGMGFGDPENLAFILANVYRETGGYMSPIKETVYSSHKDKNPSDSTVIKRLDTAFAKGQLSWVKTPYWKDGWFGRGQIQITHKDNYKKLGDAIGVDLVGDRDKALDKNISAKIAIVGMETGAFTGKKLDDYKFPDALNNPPKNHPRRIVNGVDGTDAEINKNYAQFHNALVRAGFGVHAPAPTPDEPETDKRTRAVVMGEIRKLLDELETLKE